MAWLAAPRWRVQGGDPPRMHPPLAPDAPPFAAVPLPPGLEPGLCGSLTE
ncbi:MAG: hypothetical protein JO184_19695 [Gammaproteobacteria bacterium]|nr:hypothetical protein [Gammaproteobacteria bacterium]